MIDVRRAYRAWLRRRLLWLVPSFLLSAIVAVVLAAHPDLSGWVRLPAVALACGVGLVFGAIAVLTSRVAWERARGRGRRSQLLRAELRPSPVVGLALLLLLLALLGVPFLISDPPAAPIPVAHRRPGHAPSLRQLPEPPTITPEPVAEPAVVVADPPPAPPPEVKSTPQIQPEIARIPELPLRLEDLELPAVLPVQEKEAPKADEYGFKHRPGDGDDLLGRLLDARAPFSRAGLPSASDLESWIPPELKVGFALISKSGPWRGRSIEMGFDLPIGRDDSIRLSYMAMMLTDDEELGDVEPSFTWHRGVVEYVRRIAGYTRQSTFDLAVMVGMSLDRLNTSESPIQFDTSARISPWIGLESGIWENDGVGLILRVGHSFATRWTEGWASVTDLQVVVRVNLGEKSSLELGYRIVSARFRDRHGPSDEDYTDKLDRSFMGPVAGLALRF